jgi:hypothetical protein
MLCVQDWGDEGEQDEKQEDCQRSVGVRVKDKNRVSTTYEGNVFDKRTNRVYTKMPGIFKLFRISYKMG